MFDLGYRLRRGPLGGVFRLLSWHRRLVAAVLAGLAVLAVLSALSPEPTPTSSVVTVARDLPAGTRLTAGDLRLVSLPAAFVPDGTLRSRSAAAGRLLAAPARRGEPLTDVRLLGPRLAKTYGKGRVIAPVRIADAGALALVQVGSRVDVLAAETSAEQVYDPARTLVRAARVVALPAREPEEASMLAGVPADAEGGGVLLLAVPPAAAADLARAAVTARLSIVIRE